MLSFKCVHVQVYNITQNLSTVVLNYMQYKSTKLIWKYMYEVLAKIPVYQLPLKGGVINIFLWLEFLRWPES